MNIKNWIKTCLLYRRNIIRKNYGQNEYLLANFRGTRQQQDVERNGLLTHDYFRSWIYNETWENDCNHDKKRAISLLDNIALFKSLDSPSCGDTGLFPFCALNSAPLKEFNREYIFQIKNCNLCCPWCFNDRSRIDGRPETGKYYSAEKIVDQFMREMKRQKLHILCSLGGEPTLAVEHWYEINRELEKRNLLNSACLSSSTNLTTGHFIEYLDEQGSIKKNIFAHIGKYQTSQILCSFKGTDTKGFLESAGLVRKYGNKFIHDKQYAFLEEERWYTFNKWLESGVDINPVLYDPNPDTLVAFLHKGMRRHGDGFLLKLRIAEIVLYEPVKERLINSGVSPANALIKYKDRLRSSLDIIQNMTSKYFGVNYLAIPRPAIKLKNLKK